MCVWADPGVLWKKSPQSDESYERETLETVPFQPYFGCTESFLKVLSNQYCQATRAMRAKRVVTVPEKSPKTQLQTLFRLFSDSGAHSLGTLGLPGAGGPGTPFRTLFGLFWGSGPEGPGSPVCQSRGFPTLAQKKSLEPNERAKSEPFWIHLSVATACRKHIHGKIQCCREHILKGPKPIGNTATGKHKDEKCTAFSYVSFAGGEIWGRQDLKGQNCEKRHGSNSANIIAEICSILPTSPFEEAAFLKPFHSGSGAKGKSTHARQQHH